jgi:RluA family pseudouridine synthase
MIPVRYVDNHLLVVEKPAGMLSQADQTGDEDMLTCMKSWVGEQFNKPGNVYLGLVHRLDRPASGLMVFARTSKAASRLTDQFKRRTVEKRYLAWVEGRTPDEALWEDHILKRDQSIRVAESTEAGAKPASLDLQTIGFEGGRSLVVLHLHTGRPHQIRVQCASRGFPLVGDLRYGAGTTLDGRNLALHATALALDHPTRAVRLGWIAPPSDSWPAKIQSISASWLDQWQSSRGFPESLSPLKAQQ